MRNAPSLTRLLILAGITSAIACSAPDSIEEWEAKHGARAPSSGPRQGTNDDARAAAAGGSGSNAGANASVGGTAGNVPNQPSSSSQDPSQPPSGAQPAPSSSPSSAPPGAPPAPPGSTPPPSNPPPPGGSKSGTVGGGLDYFNPQYRAITSPEVVTSLDIPSYTHGRIRSDDLRFVPIVLDGFSIGVRGTAGNFFQVVNGVHVDVSAKTGFGPAAPLALFQYGNLIQPVGATVFQMHGTSAGSLISTYDWNHTNNGEPPQSRYGITYSAPTTPFIHATSELTVQSLVRVPTSAPSNGGYGQIEFMILLRDSVSGRAIEYLVPIWDSRPVASSGNERLGWDGMKLGVLSPLRSGMTHTTVSPFSAQMRNEGTWSSADFFRVHIPRAKLEALAVQANAMFPGLGLSTSASNYALESVIARTQAVVGTDVNVNMIVGASFTELSVYEFY